MCLSKIGKRTLDEEGIGYKSFYEVVESGKLYTSIRHTLVIPDCWLLNKP